MAKQAGNRQRSGDDIPACASHGLRGIAAMIAAMTFLIANDTLVKLISSEIALGQIIFVRGIISCLLIILLAYHMGVLEKWRRLMQPRIYWRTVGEIGGTLFYLSALIVMPISNVAAIMQFLPLALTAGGAIFLREYVGWRRWSAAAVGLVGVLMIVKPGLAGFNAASVLVLICIGFIMLRELATRGLAGRLPTLLVTVATAVPVTLLGAVMVLFEHWTPLGLYQISILALAALALLGGYHFIIVAVRAAPMSTVAPFRYVFVMWALILGYFIWGEVPDNLSLGGIAVLVAAGIYTLRREAEIDRQ